MSWKDYQALSVYWLMVSSLVFYSQFENFPGADQARFNLVFRFFLHRKQMWCRRRFRQVRLYLSVMDLKFYNNVDAELVRILHLCDGQKWAYVCFLPTFCVKAQNKTNRNKSKPILTCAWLPTYELFPIQC